MHNTALERMRQGQAAIGATANLGAPLAAEMLSQVGFDFVMVDNQHGAWDDNSSMAAFHSICLGPATPMVRVRQNDFGTIGGLLDRGALGIIVPMVNSVEDGKRAAHAVRYPPREGRSQGAFATRLHGGDYGERIDDEVFLAVQIESAAAVRDAREILSVDGVDGCWIGPADLARSMGVDRNTAEGRDSHEAALASVLQACREVGKIPGIATMPDPARRIEQGFLFITVASDAGLVWQGAAQKLEELKSQVHGT